MKINKQFDGNLHLSAILAVFLLCVAILTVPVRAAEPDCDQILSTMADLHLSADEIEIEAGEFYLFTVVPADFAQPLGWQLDQIDFSEPDILALHDNLPIGTKVKVAGTDQEITITAADQITTETQNPGNIDQPIKPQRQGLRFYVEGKKSGRTKIQVQLTNPSWEAFCTHGHACKLSLICDAVAVPQGTKAARVNEADAANNLLSSVQPPNPSLTLPLGQPNINPDLTLPPANEIDGNHSSARPTKPDVQPEQPDQQPNEPGQPDDSNNPSIPSTPDGQPDDDQPGNSDTTEPTNPGNNPGDSQDPEPLKQIDQSKWQLDTTKITYNNQLQFPHLLNVQDNVQVIYPAGNIDAGSYTDQKISFIVPEGYEPIPDMVISYTIEPLTPSLRHEFDPVTGEIIATLENVIDTDVEKIERSVNGIVDDGTFNPLTAEIGHYVTQTVLTIDPAKRQNYVLDADGHVSTKTSNDVKSSTPWYYITAEQSIEENGQIAVTLMLRDPKIDVFGTNTMTTLSFNLEFDESQLTYDRHESGYWDCMDNGGLIGSDNRILGAYWGYTGPLPTSDTKICTIYFNVNDGVELKDAVISTVNWQITPSTIGGNVLPFDYYAGPTSVVVNPTSPDSNQEILLDADPADSAVYKYDNKLTNPDGSPNATEVAKKEQALQDLQDQIDVKFTDAQAPANEAASLIESAAAPAGDPVSTTAPIVESAPMSGSSPVAQEATAENKNISATQEEASSSTVLSTPSESSETTLETSSAAESAPESAPESTSGVDSAEQSAA